MPRQNRALISGGPSPTSFLSILHAENKKNDWLAIHTTGDVVSWP